MVNTIKGRRWNDLGILYFEMSHASTHPNPNPNPDPFWLQSFAMVQARTQATSIGVWVRKSTPLVGLAHED